MAGPTPRAFTAIVLLERSRRVAEVVARAPRASRVAFAIGALAAALQLAWLVPFIIDPTRDTWTAHPWRPMPSRHSCVTCYWVAGVEVRRIPSIYDEALYSQPQADPKATRVARQLGPFNIDQHEYPPTFLLLRRALTVAAPDFWSFRRLWFALNLGGVVLAAFAPAGDARRGRRRIGGADTDAGDRRLVHARVRVRTGRRAAAGQ